MGLLGYEDPDVTQGLLAFGQMASQRRPFLGLLAGLAAADRSQGGRQEQMRQREMEERKLRMEEALRQAQMGEMDAQRQQRLSAIEAAQRQAARAGEFNQALLGAGTVSPSQALAGGGGPTVANAERVGQSQPIDWQSLALRFPDQIDAITKLATARNLGRDKVARTIEVRGPDGRPQTIQVDEFGVPVGQGFSKPYEMRMQDIGGSIVPSDPFAPTALTKTQSPDSKASNALGWANFGLAKERLNFDKTRPAGDGGALVQIVGPNGLPMWVTRQDAIGKMPAGAGTAFEAKEAGKKDLDAELARVKSIYDQLNSGGGITSTEQGPLGNAFAAAATTGIGQAVGRTFGTENQKNRDVINMTRPLLLSSIMRATGMSAKQLDSNAELKLWIDAASDPARGYQANIEALNNIGKKYGSGPIVEVPTASGKRAPPVGTVEGGYRFKGGNAANPSNWEKL